MGLFDDLRRMFGYVPPMREGRVQCMGPHGLHHMAYVEWGEPTNPRVLVCVHGLTRNGRDFDFLAQALMLGYRVVCPDVAGRGRSEWLQVGADYGFPVYLSDMATLIARLNVDTVHWVGTSMGGLIGMMLAAQPGTPITRLVLNDVGPLITAESLKRIGEYVGKAPLFPSFDDADKYIRLTSEPFGALTDAQWRHLAEYSVRQRPDGQWEMRYDPALGEPFRNSFVYVDVDLWPVYEAVRCPTLLIRGADSDLLAPETALAMSRRGPRARLVEVPAVGHAPMFTDAFQIGLVRDFLLEEHPPG